MYWNTIPIQTPASLVVENNNYTNNEAIILMLEHWYYTEIPLVDIVRSYIATYNFDSYNPEKNSLHLALLANYVHMIRKITN